MPLVRFIRGVIWNREARAPDEVVEVNDHDAQILCDGYRDAVRVDGKEMVPGPMTTQQVIEVRDPVAEHRDPVVKPSQRRR